MGHKNVVQHRAPQIKRGTEVKVKESYLSSKGLSEPAKCESCQSVYHHKQWYSKEHAVVLDLPKEKLKETICPSCRKTADHFPGGIVKLNGDFLTIHKDQVLHLIRNLEVKSKEVNPLDGIISLKDLGHSLEIHTTNERFAQRIGREVKRAFKGEITYHWTAGDKFVRVDWHREGKPGVKFKGE
ncbi:MAG: hypothetical protein HY200_11210 [Nitrospirae bacterium]|nr:hypothetical protein [Nitrospirota bacterium]